MRLWYNPEFTTSLQIMLWVGIAIVIVGICWIFFSNITYNSSITNVENPEVIKTSWDFLIDYISHDGTSIGSVNATIGFSSPSVFAVYNKVSSTVNATVSSPNSIEHIYFIIPEEGENLTKTLTTYSQVQDRINTSRSYHSLIDTTNKLNSTQFNGQMDFNFTQPKTISVNAIFIFKNYHDYYVSPKFPSPFMIESHLSKIQADTDRDIQRQNLESERTNGHVEGLTIVIIGLIPIGFVMEFFIERHFYQKEKSERDFGLNLI